MKGIGLKLVCIIIGVIAVVLYLSGSTLKTIINLKNEVSLYEEKLVILKTYNEELFCKLKWMDTQDDYVKYIVRKRLGFVEPDEIKFYIIESNDADE